MSITESQEWQALARQADELRAVHLRELFDADADRGTTYTVEAADLFADYSKQRVTDETLRLLHSLAEKAGLRQRIDALFDGQKINTTEDRAVLHVALRAPRDEQILVDGEDVVPAVHEVLDRMSEFAGKVRSGVWQGATGSPVRQLIKHGMRGSGP